MTSEPITACGVRFSSAFEVDEAVMFTLAGAGFMTALTLGLAVMTVSILINGISGRDIFSTISGIVASGLTFAAGVVAWNAWSSHVCYQGIF